MITFHRFTFKAALLTLGLSLASVFAIAQENVLPYFTVPGANDVSTSTTPVAVTTAGTQWIRVTAVGDDARAVFWPTDTSTVYKTVTGTATALGDPYVWSIPISDIRGIGNGTAVEVRDGTSGLVKCRGVLKSAGSYGPNGNLTTQIGAPPAGVVTFVAWYDPEGTGIIEDDELFFLVPVGSVVAGTEEEDSSGVWVGKPVGSLLVDGRPLDLQTPGFSQKNGVLVFARAASTNVSVSVEHLIQP